MNASFLPVHNSRGIISQPPIPNKENILTKEVSTAVMALNTCIQRRSVMRLMQCAVEH